MRSTTGLVLHSRQNRRWGLFPSPTKDANSSFLLLVEASRIQPGRAARPPAGAQRAHPSLVIACCLQRQGSSAVQDVSFSSSLALKGEAAGVRGLPAALMSDKHTHAHAHARAQIYSAAQVSINTAADQEEVGQW